MYTYYEDGTMYGVHFAWFKAEGRSLHEVATMYQRKQLSKKNTKYIHNSLLVCFVNVEEYPLKLGEKYFLHVTEGSCEGSPHLMLAFREDEYMSRLWRMPVDQIKDSTWRDLMPKPKQPKYMFVLADDNKPGLRPQKYKKILIDIEKNTDKPDSPIREIPCIDEIAEFGEDEKNVTPEPSTPSENESNGYNDEIDLEYYDDEQTLPKFSDDPYVNDMLTPAKKNYAADNGDLQ